MMKTDLVKDEVNFLLRSAATERNDSCSIMELVSPETPIILYGAGEGLSSFGAFVLDKYPLKVTAILDRHFSAPGRWRGIPIVSPEDFLPENNVKTAIVTVGKETFHSEIVKTLKMLGFEKIFFSKDIYQFNAVLAPPEVEAQKYLYFAREKQNIILAGELFCDANSIDVFLKILKTHILRIPQIIPHEEAEEQYFPLDLFKESDYQHMIHCGAYHGETVLALNRLLGKTNELFCIEASIENLSILLKNILPLKENIAESLIFIPCAISDKNTTIGFQNGGVVSRSCVNGPMQIHAVTLDSLFVNFSPSIITMDIEGSEEAALRGAERLIKRFKPKLAISVYHHPAHLWRIPLLLQQFNPDYQFVLRNYTGWTGDTILYAF